MHILGQKEATWNIVFCIFERRRGPQTSRGSGKLPPHLLTGLATRLGRKQTYRLKPASRERGTRFCLDFRPLSGLKKPRLLSNVSLDFSPASILYVRPRTAERLSILSDLSISAGSHRTAIHCGTVRSWQSTIMTSRYDIKAPGLYWSQVTILVHRIYK